MRIFTARLLILVSILIIFGYSIRKNNNFVDIRKVFKDHFSIFGAAHHIVALYVIPIFTSIGVSLLYTFDNSMVEAIMVVISVVISALLSFQGGILNADSNDDKRIILNQTNASINFVVLINIVLVFIMLIYTTFENVILERIFTGIISYVLLITFLTILIIVKRIRVLMSK